MNLGGSFTHSSRIRLPATPNAALASALDPSRPLAELWEQLAIDDVIPHDWVQNPRRRFTQIVVSLDPLRTSPMPTLIGGRPEPTGEPGSSVGDMFYVGAPCFVRMHLSELHPPTFEALRTFASLDPRAVLQAEALSLSDAQRNSHPPPERVTWHFGEVAAFEDGDPDETERELYRLGFARPPHSLPWLVATIVCPLLIPGEVVQVIAGDVPSTTDTTPSS